MESEEYAQGHAAYGDDTILFKDNPYPAESAAHADWIRGWRAAEREYEPVEIPDELEKKLNALVFDAAAAPLRLARTAAGKDEENPVDYAAAFLEAAVIAKATIRAESSKARKQGYYWYPQLMDFLASLAYLTLADCLNNDVLTECSPCSKAGVVIHEFGKAMVALRVMELLDRDFDDADPAYPKVAAAAYAGVNPDEKG